MTTIWQDNATLAATTRAQHAKAATNLRLSDYADDLAAIRLMARSKVDASVVRYCVRLVTENAAAELVRLQKFGSADALTARLVGAVDGGGAE